VLQRLAIGSNMPLRDSLRGVLGHDAVLLLVYGTVVFLVGLSLTLACAVADLFHRRLDWRLAVLCAASVEETHWEGADEWDMKIAALKAVPIWSCRRY
jgi:hypothetical protein